MSDGKIVIPHYPAIDYIRRIRELVDLRGAVKELPDVADAIDMMLDDARAVLHRIVDAARSP